MTSPLRTALDNAGQLHASIVALPKQAPTVDLIVRAYAMLTGVRFEDLTGKSKTPTISHHRHRLMYLIRMIDPVASYGLIGRYLGGRDMSTIHEAVAKITGEVERSLQIATELAAVEDELRKMLDQVPPLFLVTTKPWQLIAACQILRDDQMTDAEARKAALSFLQQLEVAHG